MIIVQFLASNILTIPLYILKFLDVKGKTLQKIRSLLLPALQSCVLYHFVSFNQQLGSPYN